MVEFQMPALVLLVEPDQVRVAQRDAAGCVLSLKGKPLALLQETTLLELEPLPVGEALAARLTAAHLDKKKISGEALHRAAAHFALEDCGEFLSHLNGSEFVGGCRDRLVLALALEAASCWFETFAPLCLRPREVVEKRLAEEAHLFRAIGSARLLAKEMKRAVRGEIDPLSVLALPEFSALEKPLHEWLLYGGEESDAEGPLAEFLARFQVENRSPGSFLRELFLKTGRLSERELDAAATLQEEPFSESALADAATIESRFDEALDISSLGFFTIDDATTRDRDDAIAFQVEPDGRLTFHVAVTDVAGFIPPGSALDSEAQKRAATAYLPEGALPMLPPVLSEDRLSLSPGADRVALVVSVRLDKEGVVQGRQISLAKIQSMAALTYEAADEWITEGRRLARQPKTPEDSLGTAALTPQKVLAYSFYKMDRTAESWRQARRRQGGVLLAHPEWKIQAAANGQTELVATDQDTPARRLVAEAMILYNTQLAAYCREREIAALFRSQEILPELQGVQLEPYNALAFQDALTKMRKATLSTHLLPHEGLGVEAYLQTTSPLRRYADLVMQRQIRAVLLGETPPYTTETLEALIPLLERKTRRIAQAERKAKLKQLIRHLATTPGREYQATVLRRAMGETWVELCEFPIQAILENGNTLQIGDVLPVRVAVTDAAREVLRFRRG